MGAIEKGGVLSIRKRQADPDHDLLATHRVPLTVLMTIASVPSRTVCRRTAGFRAVPKQKDEKEVLPSLLLEFPESRLDPEFLSERDRGVFSADGTPIEWMAQRFRS